MEPSSSATNLPSDFTLPGYEAGPETCGVQHSVQKLEAAASNLKPFLPQHIEIQSRPLTCALDSWSYRCRCSFQIVKDTDGQYHFAMRHKGEPMNLGSNRFPIATKRIQSAMEGLMEKVLNNADSAPFPEIQRNLASITFSSAWKDNPDDSDCIVTLNYDQALDESEWKVEAEKVGKLLNLRQINGRSKKLLLFGIGDGEQTIRDTVYIRKEESSGSWAVDLNQFDEKPQDYIQIHYEKPETAFYHPNAHAMSNALRWMLQSISGIVASGRDGPFNLLEMYCGCGAHTIALAKSGMLDRILAVELDRRLVEACETNIAINGLGERVNVVQGDAGKWAKEHKKRPKEDYSILLVDPPRSGLDNEVCAMALQGTFEHFLYISCGHKALLRDLERLSPLYEIASCTQLDLFPRTDSIETLVHLQRKK